MAESVQCSECNRAIAPESTVLFGAPHDKELKRLCISCFETVIKKPEPAAAK